MSFFIGLAKVVFLLGFLILIHESGHFFVARLCGVKVKQFSIGFGPKIYSKQGKDTKYSIRAIPLGGFVELLGETEKVEEEGAFNKAKISKRIAIVSAGAIVNIIFGLLVYFLLMLFLAEDSFNTFQGVKSNLYYAFLQTQELIYQTGVGLKQLITGNINVNQMAGPIGISGLVIKNAGIFNFIYLLSIISFSLGITNLLPIPALDGGKIILLIIEAIRKKPIDEELELKIQALGFSILIILSIYVSINDVIKLF